MFCIKCGNRPVPNLGDRCFECNRTWTVVATPTAQKMCDFIKEESPIVIRWLRTPEELKERDDQARNELGIPESDRPFSYLLQFARV